jgi:hypothetical protein
MSIDFSAATFMALFSNAPFMRSGFMNACA